MAYGRRVGELTGSVRVRGDYEAQDDGVDAYISDAFIMDSVSQGYKEAYELLAEADPDRLTVTSSSLVTVNTSEIDLPNDMYRLRAIETDIDRGWIRAVRDDPSPLNSPWEYPEGGIGYGYAETRYRLEGGSAFLSPPVAPGRSIRFTYIPAPVSLTGSDQTIDGTAGLDEYVVTWALRECREREDKDVRAQEVKLARQRERIMGMGRDRDTGAAKRLEDPLCSRHRGVRRGRR